MSQAPLPGTQEAEVFFSQGEWLVDDGQGNITRLADAQDEFAQAVYFLLREQESPTSGEQAAQMVADAIALAENMGARSGQSRNAPVRDVQTSTSTPMPLAGGEFDQSGDPGRRAARQAGYTGPWPIPDSPLEPGSGVKAMKAWVDYAKSLGIEVEPEEAPGRIVRGEDVGGASGTFFIQQPNGNLTPYTLPSQKVPRPVSIEEEIDRLLLEGNIDKAVALANTVEEFRSRLGDRMTRSQAVRLVADLVAEVGSGGGGGVTPEEATTWIDVLSGTTAAPQQPGATPGPFSVIQGGHAAEPVNPRTGLTASQEETARQFGLLPSPNPFQAQPFPLGPVGPQQPGVIGPPAPFGVGAQQAIEQNRQQVFQGAFDIPAEAQQRAEFLAAGEALDPFFVQSSQAAQQAIALEARRLQQAPQTSFGASIVEPSDEELEAEARLSDPNFAEASPEAQAAILAGLRRRRAEANAASQASQPSAVTQPASTSPTLPFGATAQPVDQELLSKLSPAALFALAAQTPEMQGNVRSGLTSLFGGGPGEEFKIEGGRFTPFEPEPPVVTPQQQVPNPFMSREQVLFEIGKRRAFERQKQRELRSGGGARVVFR